MSDETEVRADPDEMRKVGNGLLPTTSGAYARATRRVATTGSIGGGEGPADAALGEYAYLTGTILAQVADSLIDTGISLCKMADGYAITDEGNKANLPDRPEIVFPEKPVYNPKLKTI